MTREEPCLEGCVADPCPGHQVWIVSQPPPDPDLQVLLSEEEQECVPAAQCEETSTTEQSSTTELLSSTDHSATIELSTTATVHPQRLSTSPATVSVLPQSPGTSPATLSVLPHSTTHTPANQDRLAAMAAATADR